MARKQRNESARPRYACMLLGLEAVTAAITEDRLWFHRVAVGEVWER